MAPMSRPDGGCGTAGRRRLGLIAKRALDVTIAAVALVALAPVLAVAGVLVRASLGRPVLFRQVRPGLNGQPFTILKLRTMRDAVDAAGLPLSDAERMTGVGRALRAWSIDELPELVNVLRGDMSLVGPRPLLVQYLPHYSARQARRHEVRPGLTGWAQVNGRNLTTWEERLEMDAWYVENWSLRLDLRILAKTVRLVLSRTGTSHTGHATMPLFAGETVDDAASGAT